LPPLYLSGGTPLPHSFRTPPSRTRRVDPPQVF